MPFVKSTSQMVVETDVENTKSNITDEESDNESDHHLKTFIINIF